MAILIKNTSDNMNTKNYISLCCGLSVTVIAFTVIAGWQFNIVLLRSLIPNASPATPLTAIMLFMLSTAILLASDYKSHNKRSSKILGLIISSLIFILAVYIGIQYLLNLRPSFEILFFKQSVLKQSDIYPGQSSPRTIISIIIFCSALFLYFSKSIRYQHFSIILVCFGLIIPWISLFGYANSTNQFYSLSYAPQTGMSPVTAIGFMLIGIGIIGLSPDKGIIAQLRSGTLVGKNVRKLLPLAILVPLVFSLWLNHDASGPSGDVTLSWAISSFLMVTLILFGSSIIHKRERITQALMENLRKAEKRLQTILESTPDSMIIVNSQGEIVMTNSQAEILFGFNRIELTGKEIESLIPERFKNNTCQSSNAILHKTCQKKYGGATGSEHIGKTQGWS